MEKYQGAAVYVTLALIVGAALSETFLKVTWSVGLLALIGVPIMAVFGQKVASVVKDKAEKKVDDMLKAKDEAAAEAKEGDT